MMRPLCAFTFLYTLSFLPHVLSIQCNEKQYDWPVGSPKNCCDKCPPGNRMLRRAPSGCVIECEPCSLGRYTDTYTVEMSCKFCDRCKKQNMEFESQCNSTHNAVCRCKAGYRCKDQSCKDCVPIPAIPKSTLPPSTKANMEPIPATTKSTPPPSTTTLKPGTLTTLQTPIKSVGDKVWFLVIIVLLSAGIAVVVVINIKPFLRWIRSKHGYLLAVKPAPVATCSVDEEVSTPVQEVCGKCDQPIDV